VAIGADGFPIELGAGAMAITYRARDTVFNSVVALKVIDRSAVQYPRARSRFLREARAAAQIRHPNVARVSHYGEQDGECFYVIELVEGETLETRVRRDGPMPLPLALEVMEQAARALAAAEACGVVHRTLSHPISCSSVTRAGALVVKVIDYCVAKSWPLKRNAGAEQTQNGLHWHACLYKPGAIPQHWTNTDRHALRYLLPWSYLLVSALWSRPFRWPHARRHSRETGRAGTR
jgi:serine/threonine protein kinase